MTHIWQITYYSCDSLSSNSMVSSGNNARTRVNGLIWHSSTVLCVNKAILYRHEEFEVPRKQCSLKTPLKRGLSLLEVSCAESYIFELRHWHPLGSFNSVVAPNKITVIVAVPRIVVRSLYQLQVLVCQIPDSKRKRRCDGNFVTDSSHDEFQLADPKWSCTSEVGASFKLGLQITHSSCQKCCRWFCFPESNSDSR